MELSESGQDERAEQVANAVAASPFITRYQEWRETVSEVRSKRKRPSIVSVALAQEPRVQRVIEFMRTNIHRKLSLDDMAEVAALSKSYLSRLFKAQTRLWPGEYLIRLRMKKAHTLLTKTSLSIKEVMAAVGYDTRSNFLNQFKEYFDVPPSEYRRRAQQDSF